MKLQTLLQRFGLKPKEAAIYLAALELGSGSVQKIAEKAGVVRSTTYEILETLREKGLVSTFLKKHVRYFSAEDPDQVWEWAQRKVDILKEAVPELTKLAGSARHRPGVRFYEGKEGMKLILREIIREADELLGFVSADDLFRELPDFNTFVSERLQKRIPARIISRDSPKAQERKKLGPQHLREVRIIPASNEFHGLIYIWKNKIAYFSFEQDYVAVVIESGILAQTQRVLFENLWNTL